MSSPQVVVSLRRALLWFRNSTLERVFLAEVGRLRLQIGCDVSLYMIGWGLGQWYCGLQGYLEIPEFRLEILSNFWRIRFLDRREFRCSGEVLIKLACVQLKVRKCVTSVVVIVVVDVVIVIAACYVVDFVVVDVLLLLLLLLLTLVVFFRMFCRTEACRAEAGLRSKDTEFGRTKVGLGRTDIDVGSCGTSFGKIGNEFGKK